jgi:type I restriction enzyme S subunit
VTKEVLPANTNQAVAFVRPNNKVTPNYLSTWLQSPAVKELIWLNAVQSAQPNLSVEDLGNIAICVPTIDDQKKILTWFENALSKPQATIENARRELQLFREYRTRLIADVVTGKLDVREASVKLPEEVAEGEELEEIDTFLENGEDTTEFNDEAKPEEMEP